MAQHCRWRNTANHQIYANQNPSETSPDTCQNGCYQKEQITVGENVEKGGVLVHCWWERKLVQPLQKTVGVSSKNYEQTSYHMTQHFHFWVYIRGKQKH